MTDTKKDVLPRSLAVFLTDVSSAEMDDTCGMRYWFNKLECENGILNKDNVVSQLLDTEIHNDLRTLSKLADISPHSIQLLVDDILSKLTAEDRQDIKKMELLYRRLGWFAAFAMFIEPEIRKDYVTLPIDEAIVLDKDPLWVADYPDRLLKHKLTGDVILREYVQMGPALSQEKWLQSWHYNIRLHVALAAAKEAVKDPTLVPKTAQVMGMSRGFKSTMDQRLVHPYVWGYYNKQREEWSHINAGQTQEWTLAPVWTFPGGIVAWVRQCGESVARSQFQLSPNVYLNEKVLDEWCNRRLHREREINGVKDGAQINKHLRSVYFGKATSQCYIGAEPCPYLHACWSRDPNYTPLKGNYIKNSPLAFGQSV